MPVKDMTGQKINHLTVIKRAPNNKDGDAMWLCECDCENHTQLIVKGSALRSGHTQSCGCLKKSVAKEIGHKNSSQLQGQKFGKLFVLEKAFSKNYKVYWKCICDCQDKNIVYVSSDKLTSGHTQSCGCLISDNLSGLQFGNVQVIRPLDIESHPKEGKYWECKCLCGNNNILVRTTHQLKYNYKLSCGCLNNISKGEQLISNLLNKNNISFETEKTFDTCIFHDSGKRARFDFYVENKYLIEFDGEQHFIFRNNGWNTEEHLRYTIQHDKYKNEWCKMNNIPLIRIPYTHLDNLIIEDLKLETSNYLME